tara:strand:+ start:311 stop:1483 length:1173 start_codon:yes stop_codon:yes gene_type:complete
MCEAFQAQQGGGGVPYAGTRMFPSSTGWFAIDDFDDDTKTKPRRHQMSSKQKPNRQIDFHASTLQENKCFKYLVEKDFEVEFAEKVVRCFNLSTPEGLRHLSDTQIQKELKFDDEKKTRLKHLCKEIREDDDLFENLMNDFDVHQETEPQGLEMSSRQKQEGQKDFNAITSQNRECFKYLVEKNFEFEFANAVIRCFNLSTSKSLRHLSDLQIQKKLLKFDEKAKAKLKRLCHQIRTNDELFEKLQEIYIPFCMIRQDDRDQSFVEEFEIQTIDDFNNLKRSRVNQSNTLQTLQKQQVKETLSYPLVKYLMQTLNLCNLDEAVEFTNELELQTYDDLEKLSDTSIDNAKSLKLSQKENLKKYLHHSDGNDDVRANNDLAEKLQERGMPQV